MIEVKFHDSDGAFVASLLLPNGSPVIDVKLHAADGAYVAAVVVPNMAELPKVLIWGSRAFCVGADGCYYEASSVQAFTWAEYELRMREAPQ